MIISCLNFSIVNKVKCSEIFNKLANYYLEYSKTHKAKNNTIMKLFSKFGLVSLLFLTFFTSRSQDADLSKSFINNNNIALRSIQKSSMSTPIDSKAVESFKELLKLHLISVKLFSTNKEVSYTAAFQVREGSLTSLTNSKNASVNYFKITDEESKIFIGKTPVQLPNSYLTETELKQIETIDMKDPQLFNNFTTTIQ